MKKESVPFDAELANKLYSLKKIRKYRMVTERDDGKTHPVKNILYARGSQIKKPETIRKIHEGGKYILLSLNPSVRPIKGYDSNIPWEEASQWREDLVIQQILPRLIEDNWDGVLIRKTRKKWSTREKGAIDSLVENIKEFVPGYFVVIEEK